MKWSLLSTFTTSILNSYHHKKKKKGGDSIQYFLRDQWESFGLCALTIIFRRNFYGSCFSWARLFQLSVYKRAGNNNNSFNRRTERSYLTLNPRPRIETYLTGKIGQSGTRQETTRHVTLMITSVKVFETSVTITNNSPLGTTLTRLTLNPNPNRNLLFSIYGAKKESCIFLSLVFLFLS